MTRLESSRSIQILEARSLNLMLRQMDEIVARPKSSTKRSSGIPSPLVRISTILTKSGTVEVKAMKGRRRSNFKVSAGIQKGIEELISTEMNQKNTRKGYMSFYDRSKRCKNRGKANAVD